VSPGQINFDGVEDLAATADGDAGMGGMREALLQFLALDDYLSDQAIPPASDLGWESIYRADSREYDSARRSWSAA
jgi:hypothetical protein